MVLNHVVQGKSRLQKSDIAGMSNDEIARLNYDAMIDVVLASELPVRDASRIRTFEGETVANLARMARDHCRDSVEGDYSQK